MSIAGPKLFQQIDASESGIDFTNTVTNQDQFNIFSYRNFYNGGGVAIGDVNNDGRPDVFFTANMGPNKLYLNQGDWSFEDVSATAGIELADHWSTGVAMVDVNQDGWLDIYVCNAGYDNDRDASNALFINQRDGSFKDEAAAYGLADKGYTTHAAFLDYDLDGDLDVYMLNNSFIPVSTLNFSNKRDLYAEDWDVKDFLKGGGDKLFRNDNGTYVNVSKEAGIYGSLIGFGLGITVGDVNGDHYPDMYVSNDFFERDYLYINQQDGTFKEEIEERMQHISLASMGADMADINNDGYPELFVTEMLPESDYRRKTTVQFEDLNIFKLKQQRGFYKQFMHNTLQHNNQNGTFSEIAYYADVAASDWSWGALMLDADNDGYRDILVCNGIYHSLTDQDFIDFFANDVVQRMVMKGEKEKIEEVIAQMPSEPLPNKLFHNQRNLRFEDRSLDWGLETPSFSNGAAYGDLDNDGDLDLVINNVNQPAFVYRNDAELTDAKALRVRLQGPENNPFAVGAKVFAHVGDEVINQELFPTRGFQSSVDYTMVLGIGTNTAIDSVVVIWPDLSTTSLINPPLDQLLEIQQTAERSRPLADLGEESAPVQTPIFIPQEFELLAHQEDDFSDLFNEGLVIKSLSREGPEMAVGDLDGDGQDDLVIGGARGQAAQIYRQKEGVLVADQQAIFNQFATTEDTGISFFDADGDGDLDLFIGSGGNFTKPGSPELRDKLLFNDGQGNFSIRANALPRNAYNTSVAVPMDYDQDGDLDLFVGTRSLPQNYAVPAVSLLYQNDGNGQFTDVTREVAPYFARLGMVTDAAWIDVNGDETQELVVVGEWTAPKTLAFNGERFEEMENGLEAYGGWWYAVEPADMDNDGDMDLVLGNRGENFYFSADEDHPAKIWVSDFDDNGMTEKIITQHIEGRDMPVAMKRNLTAQLVSLKKESLKHAEYAKKSIQELFDAKTLKAARVWEANYFQSAVAINDGQGGFTLQALPTEVQFSCVCDIACLDVNDDGRKDLVLGGNESSFLPQFSRLDASFGHVLLNQGGGDFVPMPSAKSGFFVRGDVRDLQMMTLNGQSHLLSTRNDDAPLVFRFEP